jgi:hypothetical protein
MSKERICHRVGRPCSVSYRAFHAEASVLGGTAGGGLGSETHRVGHSGALGMADAGLLALSNPRRRCAQRFIPPARGSGSPNRNDGHPSRCPACAAPSSDPARSLMRAAPYLRKRLSHWTTRISGRSSMRNMFIVSNSRIQAHSSPLMLESNASQRPSGLQAWPP